MASAYEAIIKIGVQGQQELDRALNKIERLNQAIGEASSGGRTIQSLQAYNTVLKETAAALRFVEIGTNAETAAVRQYVTALGQANAVRERQSKLIADQVRQQRLAASGIRETSNQYARPAGPAGNAADAAAGTFRAGTAKVTEATKIAEQAGDRLYTLELKRIEDAATAGIAADNEVFQKRIASEQAYWNRRLKLAAQARQVEARDATRAGLDTSGRGRRRELDRTGGLSFDERLAQIQERRARPRSLLDRFRPTGSRKNAIEGAAIGGGFPALFGQGAGASVGGLLGGGLGGALTGSGAFAGGIVGSLIGTQFDKLKASALGLADALKAPSEALAAMEASGIKVSSGLKNTVDALEGLGRATEAQALVFAELEKLGGTSYVQNLLELEEVNKELQEQWSKLSVQVQNELLPAFITLTETFTALAKVLRESQIVDIITRVASVINGIPRVGAELLQGKGLGQALAIGGNQVASAFNQDQKTQRERQPGPVDDTRQRKALDEAIARQKEAIDLARQGADLERNAADFRRDQEEAIAGFRKRAADYDREIAEFRKGLEDKIFDKRQQVLRAEADLARKQSQLSIERSDLALSQAGRIPSAQGGGRSQLVDAAREYLRTRAEGEADLQQKEKQSKLDIADLQRETTRFEQEVTKKIVDLRKVADDYKRDVDKFAYDTAKKIYDFQIQAANYQYAMWERSYKLATSLQEKMAAAAMNPQGDFSNAANPNFQTQYMRRLSLLESDGGRNWTNPSSGAAGFFQFLPSTLKDLPRLGLKASDALSKNFDTAAKAALDYAMAMKPAAKQLMAAGDVAGLDRQLKGLWTSLPGGAEEALPARMARANRLIGGGGYRSNTLMGVPGITEYLTGDPGSQGYRADHAGGNYHEHMAFATKAMRDVAMAALKAQGIKIGSVDRPGDPGWHGAGLAFDVPASQVPVGQERALSARVRSIVAQALGGSTTAGGMSMPNLGPMPGVPTIRPMGTPPKLGAVPNFNAETERFNELQQRSRELAEQSLNVERELAKTRMDAAQAGLEEKTAEVFQSFIQPLLDANQLLKDRAAYEREYAGLIADGVLPELAEQLSQSRELEATQLRLLDIEAAAVDAAVANTQARIASNTLSAEGLALAEKELEVLKSRQALIPGARNAIVQAAGQNEAEIQAANTPEKRYQKAVTESQANLNKLVDPVNQIVSGANAIGDAFGQAFQDVATGSKTAQEALSDMFKNIGASFIQMAAQIAAEQLTLSLLKLVGGSLLGGVGGGGAVPGLFGNSGILNSGIGAGFGGAFASGGSPPVGKISLVGENGPELFIPSVSGTIIPNGPSSAVLDSFNGTDQSSSSNEPIRVETTTINSVEYATVGQVRQASAAAAKQGEARALNRLYSSTSARKRLGM